MRTTLAEKKKHYRIIFQLLTEDNRIFIKEISKAIKISNRKAGNRLREAFEEGYIVGPHIRKRSYLPFVEYVYFVRCKDSLKQYLKFSEDERVIYHAVMDGFANLWVISKEEIDIEGDVLVAGPRSDYYMPIAPDHSWDTAVEIMRKKVDDFNQKDYEPKGYIENHWNETIEWDEEDEILYRYFKYNLRKSFTPIMKEYKIAKEKIIEFLKRLPKACTILTSFFPETISAYDPYIFVFETDYEDFIIDLFSELPTSCLFFKVSDKLILRAYMRGNLLRSTDSEAFDTNKLQIPLLIMNLARKGIIKNKERAVVAHYCRRDI